MHISEGVLSPAVVGTGWLLTAIVTTIGLRKADYERLTTAAVLAAMFFVASLVHVPLGPSNVHLILNGVLGLFLGWLIFPPLLIALLLQALFFGYGGLAVLGVNTFIMGFSALLCRYIFARFVGSDNAVTQKVAAFLCGACSVAFAALLTALALAWTDEGFLVAAKLLLLAHIPVMLVEGIITTLIVVFIAKVRPQLLRLLCE